MAKDKEEEGIVRAQLDAADLLDPNPDILGLFCHYNATYFDSKLDACTVEWSTSRMTLCAGICKYDAGSCTIRLSEPLLKFRSSVEVKETLLHEMIHAYLWLSNSNQDHDDHGPTFQKMMQAINDSQAHDYQRPMEGYHITIYHTYINEVNSYRRHHWKCIQCGDIIKRATNRAPSQSDCYQKAGWQGKACNNENCKWHRHQQCCGGEYEKIAEPEGYKSRKPRAHDTGVASKENRVLSVASESNKAAIMQEVVVDSSASMETKNREENKSGCLPKKTSLEMYFTRKSDCIDSEGPVTAIAIKEHCQPPQHFSREDETITTISKKRARICRSSDSDADRIKHGHSDSEGDGFCSVSDRKPALALSKKQEVKNKFQRISVQDNEYTVIIGWRDWYAFENEEEGDAKALKNKRSQRRTFEKASSQVIKVKDPFLSVEISRMENNPFAFNQQMAGFEKSTAQEKKTQRSAALGVSDSAVANVAEVTNAVPKPAIRRADLLSSTPVSLFAADSAKISQSEMLELNDIVAQDLKVGAASDIIPRLNDICSELPFRKETCLPISLEQRALTVERDCGTISACKVEMEGCPHAILKSTDHKMTERSQNCSNVSELGILDDALEIKTFMNEKSKGETEDFEKLNLAHQKGESAVACPICAVVFVGNIEDASFNTKFNQHIDGCMGIESDPVRF